VKLHFFCRNSILFFFGGDIGHFCVEIATPGLFCVDIHLFCVDIGLLCENIGLFRMNIGVFRVKIGLFCVNIRLFCVDIGLFCVDIATTDRGMYHHFQVFFV